MQQPQWAMLQQESCLWRSIRVVYYGCARDQSLLIVLALLSTEPGWDDALAQQLVKEVTSGQPARR